MDGFDSESDIIVDRSLEEICLLDELDNPITIDTFTHRTQRNKKHNLRSFEKADKDEVEKYH